MIDKNKKYAWNITMELHADVDNLYEELMEEDNDINIIVEIGRINKKLRDLRSNISSRDI